MDEQRLQDILGQKVEVPDMVNRRLEQTYAQLGAKHRRLRPMRVMLIAAAVIAVLCVTAVAAYNIFRQDVSVDSAQTAQGIFNGGQPSWEREYVYNGGENPIYWPKRETVQVDESQAQALLGGYLPDSGYRWQIGDYTFTVEGYVLDEHTGTAKFYYTVEHPGGFGDGAVDWEHGWLDNSVYKVSVGFKSLSDVENPYSGGRRYVDVGRSTQEKLCIVESVASEEGWKAEDGFGVTFMVRENPGEDDVLSADLELPGLKSLPAVPAADQTTGEDVLKLSSIGLMLKTEDADRVGYIALDYIDGTQYVVRDDANDLDNADYGFGSGEHPHMTLQLIFNRLVDPSQVAAVTVDGQRYEIG